MEDMAAALAPSSETTTDNTDPYPSMAVDTTTMAPMPLSSTGEETTTITNHLLSMTTKTTAPAPPSKDSNKDTNTDKMPPIGKAK